MSYTDNRDYAADLLENAYIDDNGAYRWKSSDNVPPRDFLEKGGVESELIELCVYYSNIDANAAIERYIAHREENGYTAEEKSEMKAAFGSDYSDVVDICTGKKVSA